MDKGDYTRLAKHYRHRAGYSEDVLRDILALAGGSREGLSVADVGAGTGKLTEDLLALGLSCVAVEPNDAMREEGMRSVTGGRVRWVKGSAEETSLPDASTDWVLMGSSFHWAKLEAALGEFHRILRKDGLLSVLWNPRDLKRSEQQGRIEAGIRELIPELKRVSSGAAGQAPDWSEKLASTGQFGNVVSMEAGHDVVMSRERYMGVWQSVNDMQAQAGPERWKKVLDMIENELGDAREVVVPYLTRAWTARRLG